MRAHHFGDLTADTTYRVERRHGLLKHHGDALPTNASQGLRSQVEQVFSVEDNATRAPDTARRWHETQQRQRRERLAAAGLANQAHGFPARHRERQIVYGAHRHAGHRQFNLQGALDAIQDTPDVWVTAVSPVYETEPVDAPEGSDSFLNAVVLLDTTLPVHTLLERAQAIEEAYGRSRSGVVNEPRTLDLDLIVVGDRRCDDDVLVLPHPRAHERSFVLAPWNDVEPDAEIPGQGSVAELLAKAGTDGIKRLDDVVLETR